MKMQLSAVALPHTTGKDPVRDLMNKLGDQ
jgi:hypothetical protein